MRVRYLKPHGPYAAGDVREAGTDEAYGLFVHGIAEHAGVAAAAPASAKPVQTATAKGTGRRTAAVRHDEQRG